MKLIFGSLTLEAIHPYARVTLAMDTDPSHSIIRCTKKENPSSVDIASLIAEVRGFWPDRAVLQGCGRIADDIKEESLAVMV